jgi:riboflavin kinase/FMN adenylyltransferase
VETLRAQLIVVGEDFHFGHKRRGNVALLRELGQKHDFEVVPVQLIARPDGVAEPVSSTSIRRALAGGQVEVAANLLGRPFSVSGVVVHGDKRGRTIGFPTANIEVPNAMCLPADGVYSGIIKRADGSSHVCAINLGRRPTFFEHADHSLLEAHLLDFDGDLYGERVSVTFEHFLRSERKFEGLESIKTQLQLDVAAARVAQLR